MNFSVHAACSSLQQHFVTIIECMLQFLTLLELVISLRTVNLKLLKYMGAQNLQKDMQKGEGKNVRKIKSLSSPLS